MRLSGKTRIGLRALYDMAYHSGGRQARAKEIAGRQRIPIRYLEEVLQDLRRAGLVEAQRGPRGGYILARSPEVVTVADVVRALEDPEPAAADAGIDAEADAPGLVWGDLAARLMAVLGETTLADFIARAERAGVKRATATEPQMYFI